MPPRRRRSPGLWLAGPRGGRRGLSRRWKPPPPSVRRRERAIDHRARVARYRAGQARYRRAAERYGLGQGCLTVSSYMIASIAAVAAAVRRSGLDAEDRRHSALVQRPAWSRYAGGPLCI